MRRRVLNAFALISLLIAGLLCFGHVSVMGLGVSNNPAGGAPGGYADAFLNRGQVVLRFVRFEPIHSGAPLGWHVSRWVQVHPLVAPIAKRSLWEFQAYRGIAGNPPGRPFYLLAFPIWCACIPLLIAPTIWLVKWRRRRIRQRQATEGFAIVQRG